MVLRKLKYEDYGWQVCGDFKVPRQKVLLPPLHIKLVLMKQFLKSLPRDGDCFKYLLAKFPGLSEAKIKEGVFVGPDIRRLMPDQLFINDGSSKRRVV